MLESYRLFFTTREKLIGAFSDLFIVGADVGLYGDSIHISHDGHEGHFLKNISMHSRKLTAYDLAIFSSLVWTKDMEAMELFDYMKHHHWTKGCVCWKKGETTISYEFNYNYEKDNQEVKQDG